MLENISDLVNIWIIEKIPGEGMQSVQKVPISRESDSFGGVLISLKSYDAWCTGFIGRIPILGPKMAILRVHQH